MSSAPRRASLRVLRRPRLHATAEDHRPRSPGPPTDPAVLGALRQALPAHRAQVPEEWRRALEDKVREVLHQEIRDREQELQATDGPRPAQERALRQAREELRRWTLRSAEPPRRP